MDGKLNWKWLFFLRLFINLTFTLILVSFVPKKSILRQMFHRKLTFFSLLSRDPGRRSVFSMFTLPLEKGSILEEIVADSETVFSLA